MFSIDCLRKADRLLPEVANRRQDWIAALNRLCSRNGITRGTFVFEKTTIIQTECAAITPSLFPRFMTSRCHRPQHPLAGYYVWDLPIIASLTFKCCFLMSITSASNCTIGLQISLRYSTLKGHVRLSSFYTINSNPAMIN
jgi:hypothetical protein